IALEGEDRARATLKLFERLGATGRQLRRRSATKYDWRTLYVDGQVRRWGVLLARLMRRAPDFGLEGWRKALGEDGAFQVISIGLTPEYLGSMLGHLKRALSKNESWAGLLREPLGAIISGLRGCERAAEGKLARQLEDLLATHGLVPKAQSKASVLERVLL